MSSSDEDRAIKARILRQLLNLNALTSVLAGALEQELPSRIRTQVAALRDAIDVAAAALLETSADLFDSVEDVVSEFGRLEETDRDV